MARKVNTSRLGTAAPRVEQEDLEEDVAVVTIASYDEGEVDDSEKEGGKRFTAFLTFEELGDKRLYLNKTAADALVEAFGDDADRWIGQHIPIEKVSRKFGNKTFQKVDVVAAEDWGEYQPATRGRRPAAVRGRKRGKK